MVCMCYFIKIFKFYNFIYLKKYNFNPFIINNNYTKYAK